MLGGSRPLAASKQRQDGSQLGPGASARLRQCYHSMQCSCSCSCSCSLALLLSSPPCQPSTREFRQVRWIRMPSAELQVLPEPIWSGRPSSGPSAVRGLEAGAWGLGPGAWGLGPGGWGPGALAPWRAGGGFQLVFWKHAFLEPGGCSRAERLDCALPPMTRSQPPALPPRPSQLAFRRRCATAARIRMGEEDERPAGSC